jgi:hypothetical protein
VAVDVRRAMYLAAVRLAVVLSLGATVLAVVVQSFGQLSAARFVGAVVVVGFVASWTITGRVMRATQAVSGG